MKTNKLFALLLSVGILLSFTACGKCQHAWQDATCTEPQICTKCNTTRGEPFGHNYTNGYCTACSQKDPNYIDLTTFGFNNLYGMNVWVKVNDIEFLNNRIVSNIWVTDDEPKIEARIFYGTYYEQGYVNTSKLKTISTLTKNDFDDYDTHTCQIISNDAIQYNYKTNKTRVATIEERCISDDNKKIVIGIDARNGDGSGWGSYFVPANLLDFSTFTSKVTSTNFAGHQTVACYINFK